VVGKWKRKHQGENVEEEAVSSAMQGNTKKWEIGGGIKTVGSDVNIGSGMVEAIVQPRRLQ
jgi:hypothetical protein